MRFPIKQNLNGPLVELGYQLRLRAEAILDAKPGLVGRRRALHTVAMVERSGSNEQTGEGGFFSKELRGTLARRLNKTNATLQPEEARFKDVLEWHDPVKLREEMRSNLHRLFDVRSTACIELALDMHVLYCLRRWHMSEPDRCQFTVDDVYRRHELQSAFARCMLHVPELAMWSKLSVTVPELVKAA